jgi:hypothetical protein
VCFFLQDDRITFRNGIIAWLIRAAQAFKYSLDMIHLAAFLVDFIVHSHDVQETDDFALLGMAALLIASKMVWLRKKNKSRK